jgi:hypothetical protein
MNCTVGRSSGSHSKRFGRGGKARDRARGATGASQMPAAPLPAPQRPRQPAEAGDAPELAQALAAAARCRAAGQGERHVAAGAGARAEPRGGGSQADAASVQVPAAVVALFASEQCVHGLHRLNLSMQLGVVLRAGGGVRLVCECLDLSRLSACASASCGKQGLNAALYETLVKSGAGAGDEQALRHRQGSAGYGLTPRRPPRPRPLRGPKGECQDLVQGDGQHVPDLQRRP